jgi:glutamine amidotransferase
MIGVIDYGLGNVLAFVNMYKRQGIDVRVVQTESDLEGISKLILPGVGAFDHAMSRLQATGLRSPLGKLILKEKMPVLGICVGMQMLADGSDEGILPGLGWVPGRVRAFKSNPRASEMTLPHMGWNDVHPVQGHPLFRDLGIGPRFYFLHSYFFECSEAGMAVATASYGLDFTCVVQSENVYGVQFHPEKSHHFGAALLKNFAEL